MAEIKPSAREVMEDMMVDTANILAELASDDLAAVLLALGPLLRKPSETMANRQCQAMDVFSGRCRNATQ